jgi:hypothetical protein
MEKERLHVGFVEDRISRGIGISNFCTIAPNLNLGWLPGLVTIWPAASDSEVGLVVTSELQTLLLYRNAQ